MRDWAEELSLANPELAGYSIVMQLLAVVLGAFAVLFLRQGIGYLGWPAD